MEENFLPSDLGHTTNRIHSDRIHNNEEKKNIFTTAFTQRTR